MRPLQKVERMSLRFGSVTIWLVFLLLLALTNPVTDALPSDENSYSAGRAPGDYVYRDYAQIKEALLAANSTHSDIVRLYDIGDSWEKQNNIADRDILAVKVSDNVNTDEQEPEILIMALQHAREWTTSEIAVSLLENITAAYGQDPRISWLVDNREIWLVPIVNPDGLDYALDTDEWWRKNRRLNSDGSYGVDLNRNYNGSENGDPAGSWGGIGASHVPANDVYCGESPFSEPETQAIRNLVLLHDFTMGIDFHSYGDLVLWPWGYTSSPAPDAAYLSGIGGELAASNGYTPMQSYDMYATTGDSIDWMYGGAGVFSYCIEVGGNGDGFHPAKASDVLAIINENIPMAIAAVEIAGDRQEMSLLISHSSYTELEYSSTGFDVDATVTADRGVNTSETRLFYRAEGSSWNSVQMALNGSNDSYVATIPAHAPGVRLDYYFSAYDLGGVSKVSPAYAPYAFYSTMVVDHEPPIADAGNDLFKYLGESAALDGSGSTDNHQVLNYTWNFTYNGSEVYLNGIAPQFRFFTPGEYVVTLTVADWSGNSASDTVRVTVYDTSVPELRGWYLAVAGLLVFVAGISFLRRRRRRAL